MKRREIVKKVLEELHKDGVIECNQYQGEDFEYLIERLSLLKTLQGGKMIDERKLKEVLKELICGTVQDEDWRKNRLKELDKVFRTDDV